MLRMIPALFVTIFVIIGILSMGKKQTHQKEKEKEDKMPGKQMNEPNNLPREAGTPTEEITIAQG